MLSYLNLRCNDSINSEGAQKRIICWDIEGTFSPSGPTLSLLCRRIPVVEQCVPHLRADHPVHPPCRHHGLLLLHDGPHHLEEQRSCKCRGVNSQFGKATQEYGSFFHFIHLIIKGRHGSLSNPTTMSLSNHFL